MGLEESSVASSESPGDPGSNCIIHWWVKEDFIKFKELWLCRWPVPCCRAHLYLARSDRLVCQKNKHLYINLIAFAGDSCCPWHWYVSMRHCMKSVWVIISAPRTSVPIVSGRVAFLTGRLLDHLLIQSLYYMERSLTLRLMKSP